MIHGLLRALRSRNPKTPQIRSFFCEKWLLFGVLADPKTQNPPASKLASDFRPFDPGIIIIFFPIMIIILHFYENLKHFDKI